MAEIVVLGSLFARPGGTGFPFAGKGANQAAAAARLGAKVALFGRVGGDEAGSNLIDALRAWGVDPNGVGRDAHAPTGTAAEAPGANANVGRDEADRAVSLLEPGSVLLASLEIPLDAVGFAAHEARVRGGSVVLDASPARKLPIPLLRVLDALVVDAEGAETLSGIAARDLESARDAARRLHARGPDAVIVTIGAGGAVLDDGADRLHRPSPAAAPLDAPEARDALVAGYAFAFRSNRKPPDALAFALAAGAAARPGSFPTLEEVERLLRAGG